MNITQQTEKSRKHQQEHTEGRTLLTEDKTCRICYPPLLESPQFLSFWRFFSRDLAPSALNYNQNTQTTFATAESQRRSIQILEKLTVANNNILISYKRVIETIHFNRAPAHTTNDLAYYLVIASLSTNGFQKPIRPEVITSTIDGHCPVSKHHPLYGPIIKIRQAWAFSTVNRRETSTPPPIASTSTATPGPSRATHIIEPIASTSTTPIVRKKTPSIEEILGSDIWNNITLEPRPFLLIPPSEIATVEGEEVSHQCRRLSIISLPPKDLESLKEINK